MHFPDKKVVTAMSRIGFEFDGVCYTVSMDVYCWNGNILLPDGRILGVNGWPESTPLQPNGLHVISQSEVGDRPIYAALSDADLQTKLSSIFPSGYVQFDYSGKPYVVSSNVIRYNGLVMFEDSSAILCFDGTSDGRLTGLRKISSPLPEQPVYKAFQSDH
jgi:hypothetical protein